MKPSFFGHPESPMFGVYHPPRGKSRDRRAVVVCPPVGQEFIRSHWMLRLLATQLARRGIHTFRFDYHGVGDSAGKVEQVNSLSVWTSNIQQAIDRLKYIANVDSVMLVGLRLGALLAAKVAASRDDVNSVVLWESVFDGKAYVDGLRKMHSDMLDLWVCKMDTPDDENIEEILGSRYQRSLLDQLESEQFDVATIRQPQLILESPNETRTLTHPVPGLQKVIRTERGGDWNDLKELETALLRPKATSTIVSSAADMFQRLNRFGVIDSSEVYDA